MACVVTAHAVTCTLEGCVPMCTQLGSTMPVARAGACLMLHMQMWGPRGQGVYEARRSSACWSHTQIMCACEGSCIPRVVALHQKDCKAACDNVMGTKRHMKQPWLAIVHMREAWVGKRVAV
jgi:hypothetical protein